MSSVWDTLGIAATGDVGAVRSAYARALKQIDMDTDPRAYIELREARDHALQMIRHGAMDVAESEQLVAASSPADGSPEPDRAPIELPAGTYEEHFTDLMRLLGSEGDSVPAPPDATLLRARFDALLADPRMQEIAFRAHAEAQLAQAIATALPRSAMLVQPAIAAFGWTGPSRIDTPPAIAAILDAAQAGRAADSEQPSPAIESAPEPTPSNGEDNQARFFADQYNMLVALLFPQRENAPPLTLDEQRTASGIFANLLCDPRMELVTFRVGAEAQLAQMIAYAVPRSDCILPRAIAFFNWEDTQGRIDQSDAIAHILHRARGLRFIEAVQSHDHPFHAAWTELQRPVSDKNPRVGSVHSGSIYNLLNSIRTEQPLLEQELNAPRVALWDEKLAKYQPRQQPTGSVGKVRRFATSRLIGLGIIFGFIVLAHLFQFFLNQSGSSPVAMSPPPSLFADGGTDTLSDVNRDLDFSLTRFGQTPPVTAEQLKAANPTLYTALQRRWLDAYDKHVSRSDFSNQIYLFLAGQFGGMLERASRDDLAEYWRIEISRLEMQRRVAPDDCARYIAGATRPLPLTGKDSDAMASLTGRLLLAVPYDDKAPPSPGRYRIPGAIVTKAAKIAGMPLDAYSAALHGKAVGAAPCTARIGLIEAVLDTPGKDGDRLLREM